MFLRTVGEMDLPQKCANLSSTLSDCVIFFVAFVEDNATLSSIPYFENQEKHFVQN